MIMLKRGYEYINVLPDPVSIWIVSAAEKMETKEVAQQQ